LLAPFAKSHGRYGSLSRLGFLRANDKAQQRRGLNEL
jgi:hypothetical protein